MRQSILTHIQIKELQKSPFVERVTEAQVFFTATFKEHFVTEHQRGKTSTNIVMEAGIDPNVLGKSRIRSLRLVAYHHMKQKKRVEIRQKAGIPESGEAPSGEKERIRRLEHELAYTRQELEFLKKIYTADREAEQEWLLKHRLKQSSESSGK